MVNCVRKVHSDVNLCRDTGPCIYESGLGDHRRKRFGNWARQAFVAGLNLWIDGRRQQEARLSIMEDRRGVGDFLKLTACQPGQVLGAGDVRADPAVRSQNNEPVDRCANFSLMYPSDGEMNPSLDRYSSPPWSAMRTNAAEIPLRAYFCKSCPW